MRRISFLTSQKTNSVFIIKTKLLMHFREVAVACCHSEFYNTKIWSFFMLTLVLRGQRSVGYCFEGPKKRGILF